MLVGTADIETLSKSAPTIEAYEPNGIHLPVVHCLQLTAEMKNAAREAVLPPSLHPTIPSAISIQAWQVEESPWGAFDLVMNRVYCRSGARARGFTTRVFTSTKEAGQGLTSTFGFPVLTANIRFRHGYDGADVEVVSDDQCCLRLSAVNPEPMGVNDVQYTSTLNLAHTPNGLRLVQVEAHHVPDKVDRLSASLQVYDGRFFGSDLLQPSRVVSASLCREQVEFPPVRFVCKVDELAFTGTEAIASS